MQHNSIAEVSFRNNRHMLASECGTLVFVELQCNDLSNHRTIEVNYVPNRLFGSEIYWLLFSSLALVENGFVIPLPINLYHMKAQLAV